MSTTTPEQALLDNVLATFGNIENPRLKEIVAALVRHMHAFAAEVNLTHAEWEMGIQFLTKCGQMSDENRQEVILLSDVLGLSSLVEMLDYNGTAEATEQTVLGPFHVLRLSLHSRQRRPRRRNASSQGRRCRSCRKT